MTDGQGCYPASMASLDSVMQKLYRAKHHYLELEEELRAYYTAEETVQIHPAKPQKLTEELARDAQLLITMGCGDKCPYVPGLRRDDWPLRDPKGQPMEEVRAIRDEIRGRVQSLLDQGSFAASE